MKNHLLKLGSPSKGMFDLFLFPFLLLVCLTAFPSGNFANLTVHIAKNVETIEITNNFSPIICEPESVIAVAIPSTVCEGGTLYLSGEAVGATSWSWTGPNGFTSSLQNPVIPYMTNLEAGVYYLVASNSCGSAAPVSTAAVPVTNCNSLPCSDVTITVTHVTGVVAPVDKTVSYGLVADIPGAPLKCWITSNLGASHQATSFYDATEASAGWYWQFNRKQGYKHDGSTVTPAWTITSINENMDWQIINDPCAIELGNGWRLPTFSEWSSVKTTGGWNSGTDMWNSALKIHAAGHLYMYGTLYDRGSGGGLYSSTQASSTYGDIIVFSGNIVLGQNPKSFGYSVRCIRDVLVPTTVTALATPNPVCAGFDLNLTGNATGATMWSWSGPNGFTSNMQNPVITNISSAGAGVYTLTASNSYGSALPVSTYFVTVANCSEPCSDATITVTHVTGDVAPVDKTVTYGLVADIPGAPLKCWITSNLGATHQATSLYDATEASAGWYWQFNRKQGYKHDGTNITPAWTITSINEEMDWQIINDPCAIELGNGWRLPTYYEWSSVKITSGWNSGTDAWNSPLKMHAAGHLYMYGTLYDRGSGGGYYSSTQASATYGDIIVFSGNLVLGQNPKTFGYSARCVREVLVPTSVIALATPNPVCAGDNLTLTGSATGATSWSWTGPNGFTSNLQNPVIANITYGGTGVYTLIASNAYGSALPVSTYYVTVADCCSPCGGDITISHYVTGGVAPLDKTVTYGTVADVPGALSKCWITSNLGATHQASSYYDATEASAGWYWQFNRKQGFKHDGTTVTPAWTITSINENMDWQIINDPCAIELGNGWRLPTFSEWTSVKTTGGWNSGTDMWNSALKIHSAGHLYMYGTLYDRGSGGGLYSSTQASSTYGDIIVFSGNIVLGQNPKSFGYSVRCIREARVPGSVTANASPNPLCEGSTLYLTGNATCVTAWSWTGPNGFTSNLQNPIIANVTMANAGVYTLIASNSNGSSPPAYTLPVVVNPLPANVTAVASPNPICEGQPLTLTGSATNGSSWAWSGPNGFTANLQSPVIPHITLFGAGKYMLIVSNNCGSAPPVATLPVVVNLLPHFVTATATPNPVCFRATLHLTATGTDVISWSWSGPAGFTSNLQNPSIPDIGFSNAGIYTVTATNSCGSVSVGTEYVNVVTIPGPVGHVSGPSTVSQATGPIHYSIPPVPYATNYFWQFTGNDVIIVQNNQPWADLYFGPCATSGILSATITNSCGGAAYNLLTITVNSFSCGNTMTKYHQQGNVAPVDKLVNYNTTLINMSGVTKCWIAQNLGAQYHASGPWDTEDEPAGWYWQFNRQQGYKWDSPTSTLTPDPNPWPMNNNTENSNWQAINDPCSIEFGCNWRIPTTTEWSWVGSTWGPLGAGFASVLKLHAGGWLDESDGTLHDRGVIGGNFWTPSQQYYGGPWYSGLNYFSHSNGATIYATIKSCGVPIRCIRNDNGGGGGGIEEDMLGINISPSVVTGKAYFNHSVLNLELPGMNGEQAMISLYDMLGQQLYVKMKLMTGTVQVDFPFSPGVYIVKVVAGNKYFTTRIVSLE